MPAPRSYYEVLRSAIDDLVEHGFDSMDRVDFWLNEIKNAANRSMVSPSQLEHELRTVLSQIYRRMVDKGDVLKFHRGVNRFTLDKIRPALRAELDRRIAASSQLIKLNREQMIAKTLQRFQGWATSIPAGGTDVAKRAETKQLIAKPLGLVKFEERRVLTDQGHKLISAISELIAKDGGAIAGRWHSNWRQPNYDYREDHKERDEVIYTVRDNWAQQKGLMKPGQAGYYDQITAVGEEVFCRCWMEWFYTLSRLPAEMITKKGRDALAAVREQMKESA